MSFWLPEDVSLDKPMLGRCADCDGVAKCKYVVYKYGAPGNTLPICDPCVVTRRRREY